jgi:transposase
MLRLEQEKDVERLRAAALLLEAENRRLVAQVMELMRRLVKAEGKDAQELQLRIAALEEQLAKRNQEMFGASTEKRGSGSTPTTASSTAARPSRPGRCCGTTQGR